MHKILIIEDDLDMGQLLKKFLTRNGFQIEIAQSGKKGMETFNEYHPDLTLCDLRLGDMDGTEILLKIKAIDPGALFIMMTGYSHIRTAVNVMKLGAFDYLAKPLLPDETLEIIKKALSGVDSVELDSINQSGGTSEFETKYNKIKSVYNKTEFVIRQKSTIERTP